MPNIVRLLYFTLVLALPINALASVSAAILENQDTSFNQYEFLSSGRADVSVGHGGSQGSGSFAYTAAAFADSAGGSIGGAIISSSSGGPSSGGLSVRTLSDLNDFITFNNSGDVLFRLTVQGSFAAPTGGASISSSAIFSVAGGSSTAAAFWSGGSGFLSLNRHLLTEGTIISGLPSNYIVWVDRSVHVTANIPIPVHATLDLRVSPPPTGTANALFDHTARLSIFAPDGFTFTSQSGDLLSAVAAVPEPATYALMLAGLCLVGFVVNSRKRVARPDGAR
ncbi:MAG: PEP-CTERM sorting domain-containing protein [Betaproteobacteria bacterium]